MAGVFRVSLGGRLKRRVRVCLSAAGRQAGAPAGTAHQNSVYAKSQQNGLSSLSFSVGSPPCIMSIKPVPEMHLGGGGRGSVMSGEGKSDRWGWWCCKKSWRREESKAVQAVVVALRQTHSRSLSHCHDSFSWSSSSPAFTAFTV